MSKYKFKSEVVCPWCDHEHDCSYEFFDRYDGDGDTKDVSCQSCDRQFQAQMHVDVEYSSIIANCPGHKLELHEHEMILVEPSRLLIKDFEMTCQVCKEDYYTWSLPGGKFPRIKPGTFEFIGKAKDIMAKRAAISKAEGPESTEGGV